MNRCAWNSLRALAAYPCSLSCPRREHRNDFIGWTATSSQKEKASPSLKAVFYSIDQGARPIDGGAVSFQGSVLKIALPAIGGNYEGRMNGDGNSISGTFTQGAPLPLTFTRATPQTAWAIPEPPPKPMAPEANPSFEVATIKPANPENRGSSMLVGRGGSNLFTTTNTTLRDLITMAFTRVRLLMLLRGSNRNDSTSLRNPSSQVYPTWRS